MTPDVPAQKVLSSLLDEHRLGGDRRLYREATRASLTPTDTPGLYRLSANRTPSEAVIDVYGQGYVVQAEQVGPGLAFAETASANWQETVEMRALKAREGDRESLVEVEVRVEDVLSQGGLIYPVESVTVERVWYCTLPAGSVQVREVSS